MGQAEMQPEGPPQDGWGGGTTGAGDLTGRAFPLGDWGEPAERLDELYRWVEDGALRTAAWYLRDRLWRRRTARLLRLGTTVGVATGGVLPLLDLTRAVPGLAPWGYVAFVLALACTGLDRYFGVTSGWMRDIATAQAVERRLKTLQFEWASECVREVLGPAEGTAGEAADRCLGVLRRFCEDVTDLVRAETSDWMSEFRAAPSPLTPHTTPRLPRPDPSVPAPRPLHAHPAPRPNMPRQRPPEPR
ncbi:SLATT domain-containing protein [Streptomyces sp. LaPpAH-108]|uniref:SLATT domain-containing protein n=1 Tax=Streptomyces sp. LaPpAH-108 TaxID=1155714 RepID=UPI00037A411D|nr:SLATT domain-containing protein [Streptomyces sp. LaPpAH-108]